MIIIEPDIADRRTNIIHILEQRQLVIWHLADSPCLSRK